MSEENFSERFRWVIARSGLKQVKFAKSLGLAQSSISTFLSGKSQMSQSTALLIEKTYGISSHWLLTGEGTMVADPKKQISEDIEFSRKILKEPELREIVEKILELKKAEKERLFAVIRGFLGS